MRKTGLGITLLLLALLVTAPAWAGPVDDFIKVKGGERVNRLQSVIDVGPSAIPQLFAEVDGSTEDLPVMAERAITGITHASAAPGNEQARAECEKALLAGALSDAPLAARRYALRTLSFCVSDDSLDTLARLLDDPQLAESARYCLVRCPSDAATAVLVTKLGSAEGRLKAGIIAELGVRKAQAARPTILEALGDVDREIRMAAVNAVGSMADPADATALVRFVRNWTGDDRMQGLRSCISIADALADNGKPGEAEALYLRLLPSGEGEDFPDEVQVPVLIGLGEVGGDKAIPVLIDALLSNNRWLSTAAVTGLTAMNHTDPNDALEEAFDDASTEVQRLIVAVVRERQEDAGKEILREGLKSPEVSVREDAVKVLGSYDSPEDVADLLQALRDGDESVKTAARTQLSQMPGSSITQAILDSYRRQPREAKPAVLDVLALRQDPLAVDLFIKESRNRNEAIRQAAVRGLGAIDHPDAIPALVAMLGSDNEDEVKLAQDSLAHLKNSASVEALEGYLDEVDDQTRVNLLGVIGRSSSPRAAEILQPYAGSSDPVIRASALNALVSHAKEDYAPEFREAMMSDDAALRNAGIRGICTIAKGLAEDSGKALRYASEAMSYARDDQERIPILGVWKAAGDPRALPYVEEILARGDVANEASEAALAIADKMVKDNKDKAVKVYRMVADQASSEATFQAAVDRLRKQGSIDLADYGYITSYRIAGPFEDRAAMKDDMTAPRKSALSEDTTFTVLGQSRPWTEAHTDLLDARIDLGGTYKAEDSGAFAVARIISPRAQDAKLVLGSDDDVVVWLNGKIVHEFYGNRGFILGDDVVDVKLREGENFLALKILQGGGGWEFGARLTDANGQRIHISQ